MPSPNQNSRDMQAWLAKANAGHFSIDEEYGNFGADEGDNGQVNPTNSSLSGAGRSVGSNGSLDSDE